MTIYYGYVGPDTMQPLDVNIQAELTYTGPGMLSLSLMWDDKEIDEGDIYMGMVRWNSNMSSQPFVLQRLEDDVEFKQVFAVWQHGTTPHHTTPHHTKPHHTTPAVRQCAGEDPLPTAPTQAVQFAEGVPLPTAPRQ